MVILCIIKGGSRVQIRWCFLKKSTFIVIYTDCLTVGGTASRTPAQAPQVPAGSLRKKRSAPFVGGGKVGKTA